MTSLTQRALICSSEILMSASADVLVTKITLISQCRISFMVDFLFKHIMLPVCVVDAAEPAKILDKMRLFMQINA